MSLVGMKTHSGTLIARPRQDVLFVLSEPQDFRAAGLYHKMIIHPD